VESLLGTTQIDYRVGLHEDIRAFIDAFFGAATSEQTQPPFREDAEDGAVDEAALADLLGEIVADACERGASDIHIEPATNDRPITVRLRIDGVCAAQRALPARLRHGLVARLKAMADLDPVEIIQPGLRQVQVHRRIGLTYAGALRACLRADPDVVMIGELRDGETAALAIEAALGGHLVLAAVPAGGAAEAVGRLFDVDREGGLDPVNLAEVLLGVVAQRLVRRLCDKCKEPYTISGAAQGGEDEGWQDLAAPASLYRARGCDACHGTGYRGRLALHEVMEVGPALRRLVQRRRPATELRDQALRDGMMTLRQDGLEKAAQGLTDLREVRGAA
jgi:type II secretory ATPase GspE/PulE/Tfp pilus assembly ATPase PilB-like protein